MGRKNLENFVSGWFVGEMLAEAGKDNGRGSGCGATLVWGFVLFILYCIYVISGIPFSFIWTFLKIITFPVTWDYQLLEFKLFGINNYYSFIGAVVSFPIILKGGIFLEKAIIDRLEDIILKKRIVNFPPIRTAILIVITILKIILPLCFFNVMVSGFKIIIHGFLSIFTFLFSL